jgi:hypothetical protein
LEAQTVKPSRFQGSLFQYKKFNHGGDLLNKKVGKEVLLVKNKKSNIAYERRRIYL